MKAGRGLRLGRARLACLGATAASRRVAERVSRRACQQARRGRLDGMGEGQRAGEQASAHGLAASTAGQRRSEARAGSALECLRAHRAERGGSARERERRERKGVEREIKVSGLTWFKLEIFN